MDNLFIMTATTQGSFWLWVFIIVLFLLSFISLLLPFVPGVLMVWLGFLSYHFFLNDEPLSVFFWVSMVLFTLLIFGADLYMNLFFVDRFGGSKWSKWGALIGMVVGLFLYPPLGLIFVPLLAVFFIELAIHGSPKRSFYVSIGTLAGFLSSTIAKAALQFVMIVIFFIFIIV